MKTKSLTLAVVLFIATLAIGANGLYAETISLKIFDSAGNSATLIDNAAASTIVGTATGSGDTWPLETGLISWNGNVGGWTLLTETGRGVPVFGLGALDLSFSANFTSGTTTSLTIMLTQTGTSPSFPGWNLAVGGTIDGEVGS